MLRNYKPSDGILDTLFDGLGSQARMGCCQKELKLSMRHIYLGALTLFLIGVFSAGVLLFSEFSSYGCQLVDVPDSDCWFPRMVDPIYRVFLFAIPISFLWSLLLVIVGAIREIQNKAGLE